MSDTNLFHQPAAQQTLSVDDLREHAIAGIDEQLQLIDHMVAQLGAGCLTAIPNDEYECIDVPQFAGANTTPWFKHVYEPPSDHWTISIYCLGERVRMRRWFDGLLFETLADVISAYEDHKTIIRQGYLDHELCQAVTSDRIVRH